MDIATGMGERARLWWVWWDEETEEAEWGEGMEVVDAAGADTICSCIDIGTGDLALRLPLIDSSAVFFLLGPLLGTGEATRGTGDSVRGTLCTCA